MISVSASRTGPQAEGRRGLLVSLLHLSAGHGRLWAGGAEDPF